jgi:hypothetical protein
MSRPWRRRYRLHTTAHKRVKPTPPTTCRWSLSQEHISLHCHVATSQPEEATTKAVQPKELLRLLDGYYRCCPMSLTPQSFIIP